MLPIPAISWRGDPCSSVVCACLVWATTWCASECTQRWAMDSMCSRYWSLIEIHDPWLRSVPTAVCQNVKHLSSASCDSLDIFSGECLVVPVCLPAISNSALTLILIISNVMSCTMSDTSVVQTFCYSSLEWEDKSHFLIQFKPVSPHPVQRHFRRLGTVDTCNDDTFQSAVLGHCILYKQRPHTNNTVELLNLWFENKLEMLGWTGEE